jgi:D-galactose 1-dehydrogenase
MMALRDEVRVMKQYKIAVVGLGKIAEDQHLPVIAGSDRFLLAGTASQRGVSQPGVPSFPALADLLAAVPDIDVVAICTPPGARHAIARLALAAGKHVLLEKPPTPTVSEFEDLAVAAKEAERVIFATWHSQYNAAVDEARARLAGRRIRSLFIDWKEDVRRWHPGQEWIWHAGGFGVFDPGINALSILTKIMPAPVFVRQANLVYPANRDTPIAATLVFSSPAQESSQSRLGAEFDWRQTGDQTWTITIVTDEGRTLALTGGGARLAVDGAVVVEEPMAEYEAIYRRFADLLDSSTSDMDGAPFELVSDAFLVAKRHSTDAFDW